MHRNKDRFLLKSMLLFVTAEVIWLILFKHMILEIHPQEHSTLNDMRAHLLDFLFITIASFIFYKIINKNFQGLEKTNTALEEHEARILTHQLEIETLYERERHLRSVMSVVRDINAYLITTSSIDDLGQKSCSRLARHRDYPLVWIGLIEKDEIVVKHHSKDNSGFLDFTSIPLNPEFGNTACPICRSIQEDRTVIVNDLRDPSLPHKLNTAMTRGIYSLVSLPLKARRDAEVFGSINIYSANQDGFTLEEVAMLEELAGDIGFAIHAFEEEDERKRLEQEKLLNYEQTLFSMIELIENRDSYTAGHTKRVAHYSAIIAENMGYASKEIETLYKAAMLHDIGKIQTPDAILLKPGKLGHNEYDLIQEHVDVGYNMLRKIDMYHELAEIMRHHHEHFDGSGYPDGLSGEQIPGLSRIMIVADAFDAMTTSRIYKPRMSVQEAVAELQRCSGTQFHPEVIDAALEVLPHVTLDVVHQLPTSRIDNERLAYYYKDRLTDTFNYDYLQVVMNNEEVFGRMRYACAIFLNGFTQVNKDMGWSHGDWLLRSFGLFLNRQFSDAVVFRRFGDDFFILSSEAIACNTEQLKFESPLADSKVGVSLTPIDLHDENITTIDGIESYLLEHAVCSIT
jgi:putative nucleotidyltransferase with HDIG domain